MLDTIKIKQILKTTYPFLSDDDVSLLLSIGEYVELKSRTNIIKAGKIDDRMFFILEGMVRGYYINPEGEEINVFLRPEHTQTGAPDSLFKKSPTKYNFETVVQSHLLLFSFKKIEALAKTNTSIAKLQIAGLQETVQTLIFRVESLVDKLPEERYDELIEKKPQFINTALNKHIANYLGITPNSLSRILKRKKKSKT